MGGLTGIGRGIGYAIHGFNKALDAQQLRDERQRDSQWQQQQRARQQQQWTREDAVNADLDASIAAGRKAMEEDRLQYEQQAPRNPQTLTLGGGPDQRAAPLTPYTPSRTALLKAAQAQTDELFRRGRMDLGLQHWTKAEALRGQMRAESGQKLIRAMATGGDITPALREFDSSVDDGLEIESVRQVRGQDGAPVFEIRHRNRLTGQAIEQPNIVSARDMEMRVARLLADPKEAAKFSLESYMQSLKARDDRENDERQNRLNMDRDRANRTSAEGVASRNNATSLRVAEIGAASRGGSTASGADLLREERLAAQADVNTLVDLLANTRRPEERPALQAQLNEARARVRAIGDKAAGIGDARRGGGAGAGAGMPARKGLPLPSSKSQLRAGMLYETSRGTARWNGSAFELEAR